MFVLNVVNCMAVLSSSRHVHSYPAHSTGAEVVDRGGALSDGKHVKKNSAFDIKIEFSLHVRDFQGNVPATSVSLAKMDVVRLRDNRRALTSK